MLEFRKVKTEEVSGAYKLYLSEENMVIGDEEIEVHIERSCKIYNQMLERGSYTYGCFEKRKLIAVINVNKILDYYPGYKHAPYVHLETFIVHKEYQGKGIGTQLLQSALEQVKKEGCTYVIIQSDNEAVIHIAKKVGLTRSLHDMRLSFV